MKNTKGTSGIVRRCLIIMPVVILLILAGHLIYIHQFNQKDHVVAGDASENEVYMHIGGRGDSTSKWKKIDYDLYGETVDLNACTFDGTIYNNSNYQIKDWQLTLRFHGDCFINNAWNGTMEIHENVNSGENVQTLKLSDYSLDDITLDYLYDGDLLIALHDGDYVVYHPSSDTHEMPIDSHYNLTMGFILYYLDDPDISDYEITYHYNRQFTDGHLFYVAMALALLWLLLVLLYIVSSITYRRAVQEAENKKDGMLSISGIYAIIYILDLQKNELTPVVADAASEKLRPASLGANEQLQNLCEYDCADAYREMTKGFCDLNTLPKRLSGKNTIACEFVSRTYGWCRIRFFPMEQESGAPLAKAVFAIQVINEEKAAMEAMQSRINAVETSSKTKSVFFANMSQEIMNPVRTIMELDETILKEAKEPAALSAAKDIHSSSVLLLSRIKGILDYSALESGSMQLKESPYSLRSIIDEVRSMFRPRMDSKGLEFRLNIADNIPDNLYGDGEKLKQILINLVSNATKYTEKGSVVLTAFGKQNGENVHLLFSVKDSGVGMPEEVVTQLSERFSHSEYGEGIGKADTGLGLNLSVGLLKMLGSELKVISTTGEGSEFYFEIEQKVMTAENQ